MAVAAVVVIAVVVGVVDVDVVVGEDLPSQPAVK